MYILNTIAPVFLIVALGLVLRRFGFISEQFGKQLNGLVYWVGLPCLLFHKIATAGYDFALAGKTFLVLTIGMAACIILGYIIAVLLRLPARSISAFVQGAYRGNLVYIGLPVIIYSFKDSTGFTAHQAETLAVLVLAFIVPVYNIAAVIILLAGRHALRRQLLTRMFRSVATNPLVLACLAGIAYSLLAPALPTAAERTLSHIGQIALPLALLVVGAALLPEKFTAPAIPAVLASVIKIAAAPLAGLPFCYLFNLGPAETRITLLFLACPTAVASYVMAEQLDSDGPLSAAIIVISVTLSIASLATILAVY